MREALLLPALSRVSQALLLYLREGKCVCYLPKLKFEVGSWVNRFSLPQFPQRFWSQWPTTQF